MAFGSIQRIATSRARSAARTLAATLTVGVNCTSTDVAVPMTRWFVTTSPFAASPNDESRRAGGRRPERDDAVLPFRQEERGVGFKRRSRGSSSRRGRHDLGVLGRQFEAGVAAGDDVQHLRPLVRLAVERDRLVRFHRVVARSQPDVGGAIRAR